MAKEFTVGEYLTRGGEKAVVFGVVPGDCGQPLVGYRMAEGECVPTAWPKNGRCGTYGAFPQNDLVPNKKKHVRWGYWAHGWYDRAYVFSTQETAEESRALEECPCSEVFKYPDIEVEE